MTLQFQAGQIRDYFDDGSDFGVDISYATETQPLGTAGSVKAAESVLRDEPFLVHVRRRHDLGGPDGVRRLNIEPPERC